MVFFSHLRLLNGDRTKLHFHSLCLTFFFIIVFSVLFHFVYFILSYSWMSYRKSRLLTFCFLICSVGVFCVQWPRGERPWRSYFPSCSSPNLSLSSKYQRLLNFDQPSPQLQSESPSTPRSALTAPGLDFPAHWLSCGSPRPPPLPGSLSLSPLAFPTLARPLSDSSVPLEGSRSPAVPLLLSLPLPLALHPWLSTLDAARAGCKKNHIRSHSPSSWISPLAAGFTLSLRGCTLNFSHVRIFFCFFYFFKSAKTANLATHQIFFFFLICQKWKRQLNRTSDGFHSEWKATGQEIKWRIQFQKTIACYYKSSVFLWGLLGTFK